MDHVRANVLSKAELSSQVAGVVLEVPLDYSWAPGQHLAVRGPEKNSYYSIASAPRPDGLLELAVGTSEDAPRFAPGTSLWISPPAGRAAVAAEAPRSVILIGMGTGVAPLRAVIHQQIQKSERPQLVLLHGSRDEETRLYAEEFCELEARGLLDYRPILSRPRGHWAGLRGRVQEHLAQLPMSADCYAICGSKPMVEEVSLLLSRRGAANEVMFAEGY